MTTINNLFELARLPTFISKEELSKFFLPGNYTVGKQEFAISGCDVVMSVYSELIKTLIPLEGKVKPLAQDIELNKDQATAFVFTWLYMNGAINSVIKDDSSKGYEFTRFMNGNYGIVELLEMTSWFDYFGTTTDINNQIVGIIASKIPWQVSNDDKELYRDVLDRASKKYWINPFIYANYGKLADKLENRLASVEDMDFSPNLYEYDNLVYKLDKYENDDKLAKQYVEYITTKLLNGGGVTEFEKKLFEKFSKKLNIPINSNIIFTELK